MATALARPTPLCHDGHGPTPMNQSSSQTFVRPCARHPREKISGVGPAAALAAVLLATGAGCGKGADATPVTQPPATNAAAASAEPAVGAPATPSPAAASDEAQIAA